MASSTKVTEETILQRYESLPQDLKDAMIGIGTADVIYDIGKKAGLNVEQIGNMAQEIGLIILGLTPSTNFISDIKQALAIDEEKAASLARDVNDKVFLKIRESLKRMHGAAFGNGLTKEPVSVKPPVLPQPAKPILPPTPPITMPKPAPQSLAPVAAPVQKIVPPAPYAPLVPAKPYTPPTTNKSVAPSGEPAPVKKEPFVIRPIETLTGTPPQRQKSEEPKVTLPVQPAKTEVPKAQAPVVSVPPTPTPFSKPIGELKASPAPAPSKPAEPAASEPQTKVATPLPSILKMWTPQEEQAPKKETADTKPPTPQLPTSETDPYREPVE